MEIEAFLKLLYYSNIVLLISSVHRPVDVRNVEIKQIEIDGLQVLAFFDCKKKACDYHQSNTHGMAVYIEILVSSDQKLL